MSRNSLGELKLSPVKEEGKFVFINSEVRVNGKLNRGDYIKIYVEGYELSNGKYLIKNKCQPLSKIVVRGMQLLHEHPEDLNTIDDIYERVSEMYKNQFYFGKIEI